MIRAGWVAGITSLVLPQSAVAQQEFPAVLAGHALLPAATFIPAPEDAPADLKQSNNLPFSSRPIRTRSTTS